MARILSLSIGTSFAERLFPSVGAQGTTALRVTFAAVVLTILWRPWRRRLTRRDAIAGAAGVAWAGYIVFGERAGRLRGADSVALGTAVAALVVLPFGVIQARGALLDPGVLAMGLGVAPLSSAIPYSLEMYALQRLPRQTFGILLSGEPAIGALAGRVILNQGLRAPRWLAIGSIVMASVGSAATVGRRR